MMFNAYVWANYLEAGGKNTVRLFSRSLCAPFAEEYFPTVRALRCAYCPDTQIVDGGIQQLHDLAHDLKEGNFGRWKRVHSIDMVMDSLYAEIDAGDGLSEKDIFSCFSGSLDYFTTYLSITFPDFFVPYYFKYNFNIFEKISHTFGIHLPEMPLKKHYRERFLYYGEICRALQDFRKKHHLTLGELCAFLYDFAPKYLGGIGCYIIENLPEPRGIFCIGGSENDFFLKNKKSSIKCWQCDPEALAGDMAIMYLRSPASAFDSIWKVVSTGFNDPFFYYYRCAYIEKIQSISRISLHELRKDSVFQTLPIVRKNMQGINGVEIPPSAYNHLLDISQCELPRIEHIQEDADILYFNEKDVEKKLIKPFLARLGYSEADYQQQLYIEVGNHNFALIPDFVIQPRVTADHHSAYILLEAKHSIATAKQLRETKKQARSYAKQLGAIFCIVASKEGIWISHFQDDYDEDIVTLSWAALNDADTFFSVRRLIGTRRKGKCDPAA